MSIPPRFYLGQVEVPVFNAIGSVTVDGANIGGNLGQPWAVIVNSRPGLLFICSQQSPSTLYNGWMLALFDDDGSVCQYRSPDYPGHGATNLIGVYVDNVVQTGNTFNFNRAGFTGNFIIPTLYIPNGKIVVPYSTTAALVSPCGSGTFTRSVFLPNDNFVAYEFSQAFAEASNVWVSFYRGTRFAAGGYLGNYPSAVEPFFKYADNLPVGVGPSNMAFKGGAYIYMRGSGVGYANQCFGGSTMTLNGNPFNLICGGTGDPTVFVNATGSFNTNLQPLGIPSWTNNDTVLLNANMDITGTWATGCAHIVAGKAVVGMFNQWQYLDIRLTGLPVFPGGEWLSSHAFIGMTSKKKIYFITIDGTAATRNIFQAYVAPFNLFPVQPANFQLSQFDGLMNYHRAVSPTGNFQA